MVLREILPSEIYFNPALADEYEIEFSGDRPHFSPRLNFLRGRINLPNPANANPGARNVQARRGLRASAGSREVEQHFLSFEPDIVREYAKILREKGIGPGQLNFERYLDIGQEVIEGLGFPCHRFPTEKVIACMNDTEDQLKTFDTEWYDLFVGNLGERAMHHLLIEKSKQFTARGYLIHNVDHRFGGSQPLLDIEAKSGRYDVVEGRYPPVSIGVRSQKHFSGKYVYNADSIKDNPQKIADYVVFFNNLDHHLLYITGIVEKRFLTDAASRDYGNGWIDFKFPEFPDIMGIFQDYGLKPDRPIEGRIIDNYGPEVREKLFDRLRARISFDEFMGRLKNK
jgi:hypothetical protein